jgi:hypothetical protein
LPGLLTGLGIIGTFAGLLTGLSNFKLDPAKPELAIGGLGALLEGVQHAFVVSAIAIGCAMLVVLISKFFSAILSAKVSELCERIDSIYNSGAGEEYLKRLVYASEKSEVHTAQLKDAMVQDLTQLLTNLTERQIEAHITSGINIGQAVGKSITDVLAEPMRKVSEAIESTSKGNGEQVNGMLETLLTGFMAKLEDTFGGQMKGIDEQMQKSMQTMSAVQTSLQVLVQDIQKANENATNQMTSKLEDAMRTASDNQKVLTEQMTQFVQDFRAVLADEQKKSKEVMGESLNQLLAEVGKAITNMETSRANALDQDQIRASLLNNSTSNLVNGLSTTVDQLIQSIAEQISKTQRNIDSIQAVTQSAINGMSNSAVTISSASEKFTIAGQSITTVLNESGSLITGIQNASASINTSALALNEGFNKYDSTRLTVDKNVLVLTGLVEQAKNELGLKQELMKNLEKSVLALRETQADGIEHLQSVNDAITGSFEKFAIAMNQQVSTTISQTQTHINQGIQHLVGVVQEIESSLSRIKKN